MIARQKNRYILVEASEAIDLKDPSMSEAVSGAINAEIGAIGYAKAGPRIVRQMGDRSFIIRVSRGHEGGVILALAFIKYVCGRTLGFYTIKTSGSVRKLVDSFSQSGA